MLADPNSVTINAVAQSLPAVARGINTSTYRKDDGTVELVVSHAYGKRTRRTARLNFNKISSDPLVPAQNQKFSMSAYVVIDVPIAGFTNAEQKQIVDALTKWLTDTSGANTTKVIAGES